VGVFVYSYRQTQEANRIADRMRNIFADSVFAEEAAPPPPTFISYIPDELTAELDRVDAILYELSQTQITYNTELILLRNRQFELQQEINAHQLQSAYLIGEELIQNNELVAELTLELTNVTAKLVELHERLHDLETQIDNYKLKRLDILFAIENPEESQLIYETVVQENRPPSPIILAREAVGNDDIVAFIDIPGAAIQYAVVQGRDNDFYLERDLYHQDSSYGSIFLDYLNCPYFSDRSSIIYGHNMRSGAKFHNLRFYRDRAFFKENNMITLITMYDVLQYEIFAVFITHHLRFNYLQIAFPDNESFLSLINQMSAISEHPVEIEFTGDEQILILSTCWGGGRTPYRLVVVGRLVER